MRSMLILVLFLVPAFAQEVMNQGVAAFMAGRYAQAVELFQHAADQNPADVNARLYLGTALISQYMPGEHSAENDAYAESAAREFKRVLELDRQNKVALASLASLSYQRAQGLEDLDQKSKALDEAASWYRKVIEADPGNREAYYSLAVIGWGQVYPRVTSARKQLGMRPEEPGPLTNNEIRVNLKLQYGPRIDEGVKFLEQALRIDPNYGDAMAYMNLLQRLRADLADSPEQARQDTASADQWVQKALDAMQTKTRGPQKIRIGGDVQQANLIRQVQPVYPPLAQQARIQGTVRFTVTIGKDGRVSSMQVLTGHPLLVVPAQDAVKQYEYKPVILNGEPVEVVTQVDVIFSLPR